MKICMLTSMHPPEDGRIFHKESKSLSKKYDMSLIAPGNTFSRHATNGIFIITVKKPKSRIFHIITLTRLFLSSLKEDADVYHCHEPDALLIGILLKKIKNKKVVYDVHEHWPSMAALTAFGPLGQKIIKCRHTHGFIQSIAEYFELYLAKKADRIITVSDSVAERFNKIGLETCNIMNVPIILPKNANTHDKNPNDIVYVCGKLGFSKGVDIALQTLLSLKKDYPHVHLTLIGNVQDNVIEQIDPLLKEQIEITGFIPYEQMYKKISEGGIGLILFQNTHYNSYIGLPNKLFDYMMCGLPVVASDFPEIRKVIQTSGCGVVVDVEYFDSIVNGVKYLLDNPDEALRMGENGRRTVEIDYNWKNMEEKLFNIYKTI